MYYDLYIGILNFLEELYQMMKMMMMNVVLYYLDEKNSIQPKLILDEEM